MPFLSVSPVHFRNLQDTTIDLLAPQVFFVGDNGQGKTNILEALYVVSYASSFRTRTEAELVKTKENSYSVRGFYRDQNGKADTVAVQYDGSKKKILKNGKAVNDRKDLIDTIPCVLFCHDDLDFAAGEPERRRFFIDQSLSMYDVLYVDVLRKYKKILKSRNSVLREERFDMLDVYDIELTQTGREIVKKRYETLYRFNHIFTDLYERITGINGVTLLYDSAWKDKKYEQVLDILQKKRESDKIMKTTLSGPHRDKIRFMRFEQPFIPSASTGQRRLAALLLRVCQAVHYTEVTGKKPVLLMDDVLLELDPNKRESVTGMLPPYDQLFCTFLTEEPYRRYMKNETRVYSVKEGCVSESS